MMGCLSKLFNLAGRQLALLTFQKSVKGTRAQKKETRNLMPIPPQEVFDADQLFGFLRDTEVILLAKFVTTKRRRQ